jgi:MFS family permease
MRSPASQQSRVGLDCLNFLIGSIQTSLGTFVAFYLADLGWSKESVGLALATGQIAGVIGQIPGGAITDAIHWKRGFAAAGILMSMGAALILAIAPLFALVFVAEALDGVTAAIVTSAVAAISLGLVGRRGMSSRTGRNFRFAAAGIAITALAQGLIGSYVSKNAIFLATAILCALALVALSYIRSDEIDYARARNASAADGARFQSVGQLIRNRSLIVFVLCLMLFQFADASTVPLLSQEIGKSKAAHSSLQISGLIISTQLVVMLLAPLGRIPFGGIWAKTAFAFGFWCRGHSLRPSSRYDGLQLHVSWPSSGWCLERHGGSSCDCNHHRPNSMYGSL